MDREMKAIIAVAALTMIAILVIVGFGLAGK